MDATSTEKEVMLGIYELDGDHYKVCFAPTGKPRPVNLDPSQGAETSCKSGNGRRNSNPG